MVVELVPLKGGIGSIWGPPNEGKDYKWYISNKWYFSCELGDGLCHRSHLLGEPETTIDSWDDVSFFKDLLNKNPGMQTPSYGLLKSLYNWVVV